MDFHPILIIFREFRNIFEKIFKVITTLNVNNHNTILISFCFLMFVYTRKFSFVKTFYDCVFKRIYILPINYM